MHRFSALDGLRGVFALAIALFHLRLATHLFGAPLLRDAYLAVDFFFVLSGFVIAHAYDGRVRTPAEAGRFLVRRVGRVWPLHVATLAALVALELMRLVAGGGERAAFSAETDPAALIANLALVQAWGAFDTPTWNIPAWSISAELFAYLAFAAVSLLAPARAAIAAFAVALVSTAALALLAANMDVTTGLALARVGCGFFLGVLVHAVWRRFGALEGWSGRAASLLELGLVAAILAYVASVQYSALGLIAPPLFALAVYVFAAGRGIVSRLLRSAPLQFLGRVSFSIYLLHFVLNAALGILARLAERATRLELRAPASSLYGAGLPPERADWLLIDLGNPWANDLAMLAYLAVLLGLSALAWRLVERPGQALFARLADRIGERPPAGITAPAA